MNFVPTIIKSAYYGCIIMHPILTTEAISDALNIIKLINILKLFVAYGN